MYKGSKGVKKRRSHFITEKRRSEKGAMKKSGCFIESKRDLQSNPNDTHVVVEGSCCPGVSENFRKS